MIVENDLRRIIQIGTVIVGILLAVLFIFFSSAFQKPQLDHSIILTFYVLLGIALAFTAGMLLSSDMKRTALLFGSIFLIISLYNFKPELLYIESIAVGIFFGGFIIAYILVKNRFDLLAVASRILLTIFFFIVLSILVGSFFNESSAIPQDVYTNEIAEQIFFTHLMGIIFAFLAYLFLFYSVVGVKSSEVFVFGPRNAGKTYFMNAFSRHISSIMVRPVDDVIIAIRPETEDAFKYGKIQAEIEAGNALASTPPSTLAIYQFSAIVNRVRPVTWTFVDYAGENMPGVRGMPELDDANFNNAIKILAEKIKDRSEQEIRKTCGTIEFVKLIKKKCRDQYLEDADFRIALITAVYHGYLRDSGKIIFIADGERMINMNNSRPEMVEAFDDYGRALNYLDTGKIFDFFGARKKYCIVVTKLDKILSHDGFLGRSLMNVAAGQPLTYIQEGSELGIAMEKELRRDLLTIPTYTQLENTIRSIDLHFIGVSCYASANPDLENHIQARTQFEHWGFKEVVEFGS